MYHLYADYTHLSISAQNSPLNSNLTHGSTAPPSFCWLLRLNTLASSLTPFSHLTFSLKGSPISSAFSFSRISYLPLSPPHPWSGVFSLVSLLPLAPIFCAPPTARGVLVNQVMPLCCPNPPAVRLTTGSKSQLLAVVSKAFPPPPHLSPFPSSPAYWLFLLFLFID